VSRSVYASLFAVVGTTYGIGDGSTTFNLPELRGEFIRGYNNQPSTGLDPGRVFASTQAEAFKSHIHTASDSGHVHQWGGPTQNSTWVVYDSSNTQVISYTLNQGGGTPNTGTGYASVTIGSTGGTETRPVNVALLPCIKT
jgi:microcystin-dependent protein